jgi:hypothetical protein
VFQLYGFLLVGQDGEQAHSQFWSLQSRTIGGWRDRIIKRHSQLFHDERGWAPGYPDVGSGWSDLIELAVERIARASRTTSTAVHIAQVKQKYGTLRLYTNWIDDPTAAAAVEEAAALAEARSACTCEDCGRQGRLHRRGGVLATSCKHHARGIPVEVRLGWENIRIVRALRDGRVRIISCRRYLRAEDAFVDVPLSAIGLKE